MECIRGKYTYTIDHEALRERLRGHTRVLIDLGTGDGRFVSAAAAACPDVLAIGVDACRENLRRRSRTSPANALFVIADACALPAELSDGLATHLTINFPWGSLLTGLLANNSPLPSHLGALTRAGGVLEVQLNAAALAEAGLTLSDGGQIVRRALRASGFDVSQPVALGADGLRACPTTWAQRLAFGRDPRALYLRARRLPTLAFSAAPLACPGSLAATLAGRQSTSGPRAS